MQGGVGHDGLALLELHLHLRERRDVGPVGVQPFISFSTRGWGVGRDGWQARLHSLAKNARVAALLTAHLRREPLEFAVETVRGRGEPVRM